MFTAKLQKSSKKGGWTCVVWPACVARHHRQQVLRLAERYGKVNEHNGWVRRDFWLEEWEKQAIIGST